MLRGLKMLSWAALLLAAAAGAVAEPEPALAILDAFLRQTARIDPTYRADLRLPAEPGAGGDGRLAGQSAFLGPFTYRAKTYADLSPAERIRVLQDPQFHAFLLRRTTALPPPAGIGPAATYHCSITPEDMLRPGVLQIVLPSP